MVEIKKGVPLPDSKKDLSKSRYAKYPFREMEVFDSVFFPKDESNANAQRAALKYAKDNGKVFITKMEKDGLRVWRTH